jgi:RPA family protein
MNKIFKSMMAMAIAAFTFTACEDVPEPYNNPYDSIKGNEPVVVDPKGSGTAEDPWNVTALVNACEGLAGGDFLKINGKDTVYVTGIVVATTEVSTQYGNATYTIADDKNGVAQFLVYRGKLLNGANVTAETDLQVGDSVTVCGKVKNYVNTKDGSSTLEFDQGNFLVYLKKANGETPSTPDTPDTPEVKTVGSKDAPKTVAEALTAINAMEDGATSEEFWFIKGKVVKVTTNQTNFEKYGNLNYLISEDGTENNTITVYSGDGLNGEKFTGIDALQAGDEVIVYGQILKYVKNGNVTPEIAKGNYLVSLNNGSATPDTPSGDEAKAVTVAEFNAAAESTDVWYKLTGTIKNLKDGDLYGNFDLEDATGSVYVYGLLSEKGGEKKKFQELVAKYGLKEGMTITIIGNRGSYKDKIEVLNAYFVSASDDNSGNSSQTGADGSTIISVADFNAAAESTDVWYQLTGTIKNLKDNDMYGNFDLEDATGSVYVYGVLSEKGGEKKKFQELVAAKGIANGKKITIVGNRGSYKDKIEVLNAYFIKVE